MLPWQEPSLSSTKENSFWSRMDFTHPHTVMVFPIKPFPWCSKYLVRGRKVQT